MSSFVNHSPPSSPNSHNSAASSKTESLFSDSGSNSGGWPEEAAWSEKLTQTKVNEERKNEEVKNESNRGSRPSQSKRCSWCSRIFFVLSLVLLYTNYAILASSFVTPSAAPAPPSCPPPPPTLPCPPLPPVHPMSIGDFVPKFVVYGVRYDSSFNLGFTNDQSNSAIAIPAARGQLVINFKSGKEPHKAKIQVTAPCEIEEIGLQVSAEKVYIPHEGIRTQLTAKFSTTSNFNVCKRNQDSAEFLENFVLTVEKKAYQRGYEVSKVGIYTGVETLEPKSSEGGGFEWRWRK